MTRLADPPRRRAAVAAAAFLAGGLSVSAPVAAQTAPGPDGPPTAEWRFPVGERAVYDVTFGPVKVGRGRLQVEAIDTLRGTPAYRVSFEIEGGPFFYKIDDRSASWVAPRPFRSLRFEQILNEGDYHRHRRYELDQASGTYTREDWDAETGRYRPHDEERDVPMPEDALDEVAFLFLVRALPLEPGRTYRFQRYFEEEGNPVVLEVLRRERVRVSAGRFETVVVRPIIRTGGMFGEGGRAEVYMTDDDRRVIVQLRTRMKVGQLNMYLREYEPGGRAGRRAHSGRDAGPPRTGRRLLPHRGAAGYIHDIVRDADANPNEPGGDLGKGKYEPTTLDRARDELFSHIQRCGVLEAEEDQRVEWLTDTIEYLAERYPDLSPEELAKLRTMGDRYCSPAIPHGDAVASDVWEGEAQPKDDAIETGEVSAA